MAKIIESSLGKEIIVEYKGYVIRSIPESKSFIAIPKNTLAFYHMQEEYESKEEAVKNMMEMIDSEIKE